MKTLHLFVRSKSGRISDISACFAPWDGFGETDEEVVVKAAFLSQ